MDSGEINRRERRLTKQPIYWTHSFQLVTITCLHCFTLSHCNDPKIVPHCRRWLWMLWCHPSLSTPVRVKWGWWSMLLLLSSVTPTVGIKLIYTQYSMTMLQENPSQQSPGEGLMAGQSTWLTGLARPRSKVLSFSWLTLVLRMRATTSVWPRMIILHPLSRLSKWMSCVSMNSKLVELQNVFKVGPEVSAIRPELLVQQGSTTKLGCHIRGYPAPTVHWLKDEKCRLSSSSQ